MHTCAYHLLTLIFKQILALVKSGNDNCRLDVGVHIQHIADRVTAPTVSEKRYRKVLIFLDCYYVVECVVKADNTLRKPLNGITATIIVSSRIIGEHIIAIRSKVINKRHICIVSTAAKTVGDNNNAFDPLICL